VPFEITIATGEKDPKPGRPPGLPLTTRGRERFRFVASLCPGLKPDAAPGLSENDEPPKELAGGKLVYIGKRLFFGETARLL